MKPRTLIATTAIMFAALTGCSSDPSPSDHTEEGVKAALSAVVAGGMQGDRTAEEQEYYCTELITAAQADTASCQPPYEPESNLTWKEIVSIDSVDIAGDTATVQWHWRGKTDEGSHSVEDQFFYEEGSWRYEFTR